MEEGCQGTSLRWSMFAVGNGQKRAGPIIQEKELMKRVIRQVGRRWGSTRSSPDFSLYVSTHPWKILSPSLPGHVFKSHWWVREPSL